MIKKETDLFPFVKDFLHRQLCLDIYSEVLDIDVIGMNDDFVIGIEMKRYLNLKVIEQAFRALKYCDYTYIAVPLQKTVNYNFIYDKILKPNGIGLLIITDNPMYSELLDSKTLEQMTASYGDKPYYTKMFGEAIKQTIDDKNRNILKKHIEDFSHLNIGGSKSGGNITRYSYTMKNVKEYLKEQDDWCSIDDIVKNVSTHYKNPRESLIDTLKQPWNDWVISKKVNGEWHYLIYD